MGTLNALDWVRSMPKTRFVYISTIGVLPTIQYEPVDANHPVVLSQEGPGASFYGATKLASEALCWAYHQSFGTDICIVRPSAVYGFGMQWPVYVKPMVEESIQGKPVFFPTGRDFPRDFTHVEDVAEMIRRCATVGRLTDRVFYGSTGKPLVTTGALATLVEKVVDGARITVRDGFSEADMVELKYRGRYSIANAEEQLGYRCRFQLEDGIREYASTFRRFLEGPG